MLCVLPEDTSGDVALHIHFTLIEAFCWENDIRVVKVQFESILLGLVTSEKFLVVNLAFINDYY